MDCDHRPSEEYRKENRAKTEKTRGPESDHEMKQQNAASWVARIEIQFGS